MSHRLLALGIALIVALLAGPAAADGRPSRGHRVGFLAPVSFFYPWAYAAHLWLGELGYVRGQNVVFEHAHAVGGPERLAGAAAELARRPVAVIVAAGTPAVRALARATRTVPIVMVVDDDPVKAGLVESLARPGGNVTGVLARVPALSRKRLDVLKEVMPDLGRVAVLRDPADLDAEDEATATQNAAARLGVALRWLELGRDEDLEAALGAGGGDRVEALLVVADGLSKMDAARITKLAAERRLPAIYPYRYFVDMAPHGGLISYGPSPVDLSRHLAVYVDKVLRGANPAELPIERPNRYELVVNLKTAAALGLAIPPSVRLRADQLIR